MKRRQFLALSAGGVALSLEAVRAAQAQAPENSVPRAWVGASLWTGDGRIIEDGTLLTLGERILSVGKAAPLPPEALVVQAQGAVITPGYIATETALGLMEIELEPSTIDARPRPEERADLIRAGYSAADGYNPLSTLLAVARREGVTSAVATPDGGLVSGTSAWVDLVDRFPATSVVREHAALHANVFEVTESSRPGALGRLREALESARVFARSPQAFDQGQTRDLRLSLLDLQRLSQVIGGAIPLTVRVARGSDVLRLLKLAEQYRLRLILSGAEEAWTVARELAAARVPVIVNPMNNLPSSFSRLNVRRDNAALLAAAGVAVCFSTFDAYSAHNLRQLAGHAVASGLSRDAALGALTSAPALAFGMDQDYGVLAAGRLANFCVWNGDPFELQPWATEVVVRGRNASTRSRQNVLFDRYRDLSRVPRGRAGLPARQR
jgi:imidazolonepropionase-like amidohydrolase